MRALPARSHLGKHPLAPQGVLVGLQAGQQGGLGEAHILVQLPVRGGLRQVRQGQGRLIGAGQPAAARREHQGGDQYHHDDG